MSGDTSPTWHLPLATSPQWQSLQLTLDFEVTNNSEWCEVVASALRQHSLPPIFNVWMGSRSIRYDKATINGSDDLGPVSIALVIPGEQVQVSPTAQLAIDLGVPILLAVSRPCDNRDAISITFVREFFNSGQASWLILHIRQTLVETRFPFELRFLRFREAEKLLFQSDSAENASNERRSVPVLPPEGPLLHTCFYERVKGMPLAPALCIIHHPNSQVLPTVIVSYIELFVCALNFARGLELQGLRPGDSVILGHLRPDLAVVTTIALSISGIASILPDEGADIPITPNAIISDSHLDINLPLIDPSPYTKDSDLTFGKTLWSNLPDVRGEDPFLVDIDLRPDSTISNADFLTAVLKNYTSMNGSDHIKVLYTDDKLNRDTLAIIWQTILHGGSICSILDGPATRSVDLLESFALCTHLFLDEASLINLLGPLDVKDSATSVVEWANHPIIILPHQPSSSTKDLLVRSDLPWTVHALNGHGKSIVASVDEPICVILSRTSRPDLTPQNILLHLKTGINLNKVNTGRCVKRILGDKVVKYGMIRAVEALSMEYVRTQTHINVPIVHLVFSKGGCIYIVMDYIQGRTLQDEWTSLNESERLRRALQIANIITELHQLPPSTIPGPLDATSESKCEGPWFTFFGAGPFISHPDLAAWLNGKLSIARKGGEQATSTESIFDGTRPLVFTHQDLSARNFITDDNGNLWVIDWELAGWYPEYFEYACIASVTGIPEMPVPEGWKETIIPHLKSYEQEYHMLQSIRWVLDVMPFS